MVCGQVKDNRRQRFSNAPGKERMTPQTKREHEINKQGALRKVHKDPKQRTKERSKTF